MLFSHKSSIPLLLIGCLLSSAWDFRVFGGEKLRAESIEKVIIDAGHGGHDPGNLGTGKYRNSEKHIALEVALRAGQLIERELRGVEVIFTRKPTNFLNYANEPHWRMRKMQICSFQFIVMHSLQVLQREVLPMLWERITETRTCGWRRLKIQ